MNPPKARVAVLISGHGSNLQALLDATQAPDYPARIVLVISNKAEAHGLDRARQAGVPSRVLDHRAHADRADYDAALDRELEGHAIDFVCLAGFMRLLTPAFVARWEGRMLNIHPSLLPAFKGLDTHRRVLEEGARFSGCTVHFVTAGMDEGPIILQAALPVRPDDDEKSLAQRIHLIEHRLYPEALRLLAGGALRVEGKRVLIRGHRAPEETAINPLIG